MLRDFAGIVGRTVATDAQRDRVLRRGVTQKPDCSAISAFATLAAKFFFHESARCFIFVTKVNLEAKV